MWISADEQSCELVERNLMTVHVTTQLKSRHLCLMPEVKEKDRNSRWLDKKQDEGQGGRERGARPRNVARIPYRWWGWW